MPKIEGRSLTEQCLGSHTVFACNDVLCVTRCGSKGIVHFLEVSCVCELEDVNSF